MLVNFLPVLKRAFTYYRTDMAHSQQNHRTLNHYRLWQLDDAGSILKVCPLLRLIQYCSCDQIEEMRWAEHVARMGDRRGVAGFRRGNLREGDHLEVPGVEGGLTLGWVFRKWDVGKWTGSS
jgi:hypothetical protein